MVFVANFGVTYSLSISIIEPLSNLYRLTNCWSVQLSKEHVHLKRFVVRFSALQTMPPFFSFLYYLGQGRSCPRKHNSFVLHLGRKRLVTRHFLQLTFLRRNDVFFLNIGKSWWDDPTKTFLNIVPTALVARPPVFYR